MRRVTGLRVGKGPMLACSGSAMVMALAIAAPAHAQDAQEGASSASDNEIIVTARKQEESLQDVPVAVTVISGDTLTGYRIDEAADILSRVPALNVQTGGSGAGAQIFLRGVGSTNISNAFDSAVALNYDGVAVSTQRLLQSAFFDVAQIEVLKGPQPLFFGKSASAGVFSLRSADPTPTWEYAGRASYEIEEEGYTVGGYISGPVSDTLGIRLAGEYQDIKKLTELADDVPAKDRDKGLSNLMLRLTLDWEPTDTVNANLKLNYNRQRSEVLNMFTDVHCGADGLPDPSVILGGLGGPDIGVFAPTHDCNIKDGKYPTPDGHPLIDSVPTGTVGDGRDISQAFNNTETFFGRLAVDIDLSDTLTLSSVTGYVDMENEYNDSFNSTGQLSDGTPAGLVAPFRNTLEQITQEVRLTSDFDGPFNFMIGGFYEDRDMGLDTSQNAFNPSLLGVFGPPFGPDALTGFTFDWYAQRPLEAEAISLFASASFEFSEQWELSGGVRWTDEEKSTSISFPYVHSANTILFGAVSSGFFAGPVDFSDSNVSPEVVLTYEPNPDLTIYGAFKTGFKSGGIDNNTLPTGSLVTDLNSSDPAVVEAAADSLRFKSETSIGGEIGIKAQLADRRLTLNTTLYHYVFEDLQIQNFVVSIFNFDTFNAGELTTTGVDVEWIWDSPVEGLTLSGAAAYLNSRFTGEFLNTAGEDLDGRRAARAPKWAGNIAADFLFPVDNDLEFGFSTNVAFSDSYITANTNPTIFDPVNSPGGDLVQDSYVTVDAAFTVGHPNESWKLSLIANNLTDRVWINTSGNAPFRGGGDDLLVTLNRGRQVFVEAAFKF